jgi:ribosomal protein L37AE/L43A
MLLGYTRCCRIPEKVIADAAIARRRGVEPSDVTAARDAVAAFDQHGECPTIANAKHSCRWTCRTCNRALDGTGYSHTTMHPKYTVSWVKTRRICHLWVPPVGVVDRDLVSGDRVRE